MWSLFFLLVSAWLTHLGSPARGLHGALGSLQSLSCDLATWLAQSEIELARRNKNRRDTPTIGCGRSGMNKELR